MKRILSLLLVCIMIAALFCGCSKNDEPAGKPQTEAGDSVGGSGKTASEESGEAGDAQAEDGSKTDSDSDNNGESDSESSSESNSGSSRAEESLKPEPVNPEHIEPDSIKLDINNNGDNTATSTITATAGGQTLWTYTTPEYAIAQLASVEEIGVYDDLYIFNEIGTITALDRYTGQKEWTNTEFQGAGIAYYFDGEVFYICGYFTPNLFAMDMEGNTLTRIEWMDGDQHYWPYKIEPVEDGVIAITFEGSSDGYEDFVYYVNTSDFSYYPAY